MNHLESHLKLPNIVVVPEMGLFPIPEWGLRIEDSIRLLNRQIDRWNEFHDGLNPMSVLQGECDEAIRLVVIESTFSFATFFFLLQGFHRGVARDIASEINTLSPRAEVEMPKEPTEFGSIKLLRTIRNKMIAHTAHEAPLQRDSMDARLAYLQWYVGYWGAQGETTNRRLNTFGLNASDHAVPPEFEVLVGEVEAHIRDWESCIESRADILVSHIRSGLAKRFLLLPEVPQG